MRPLRFRRPRFCCALLFPLLAGANLVDAQSGGASITLQPVPPKTVPPSDYPPGTTIVGQEITLGSVPARVWFEIHVTGWAPEQLHYVQARTDSAGFLGENADCMGQLANTANIEAAEVDCTTNLVCREALAGTTNACPLGGPTYCSAGLCEHGFKDQCHPKWSNTEYVVDQDLFPPCHFVDRLICVFLAYNSLEAINDLDPTYLGTLVVDVPATAKGTYTIGFREGETFLQNFNPPPNNTIPISAFNAAVITAPCGRCCSGYAAGQIECVDHVTEVDCNEAEDQVFTANAICPENGGTNCPGCASNSNCDDGLFCNGVEVCEASGVCGPGAPPCEVYEACEEDTDSCAPRIPTVNTWGMIVMTFLLLIASKLRYRRLPGAALPR